MTRMTGVKIEWTHGNPSDFFAKMLASRGRQAPFDVVLLDDAVQDAAIKAGVVAKLDPALVPNLDKLYPRARNPQGYGPYAILYSIGIVYNKDKLKAAGIAEPTSWQDLWNPKLAGHISIPDISLPQGADFVMKMAQLNGGSEADVIPGLKKIAEIKANSYYTSSNTLGQQLASGDVWVSVWTSGRAWAMINQGYPIGYAIPKEGSVLGIDTVDMVAGTAHPKEAQALHQHADRSAQPARLGDGDGVRTEQRDAAKRVRSLSGAGADDAVVGGRSEKALFAELGRL